MTTDPSSADIAWILRRLTTKGVWNILSVDMHLKVAAVKGRLNRYLRGVPGHVRDNMESVFGSTLPSTEIDRIARKHVEFQSKAYLTGLLPMLRGFDAPERWPVDGLEHLDDALKKGRGALLTTAHFGHARMIGPILRVHGYPAVRVVAKSMNYVERELRLQRWIENSRFRQVSFISDLVRTQDISAQLDIRPILNALNRNVPIMIAGDGLRAAEFVMLPFLGKQYPFALGSMKIAVLTGTSVLPCFVIEDTSQPIHVEIKPAIDVDPRRSPEENTREFAAVVEETVMRHPALWSRWDVANVFEKAERWSKENVEDRWNQSFRQWS
jgi:KDO2-lipid IV(A) lauroyltransferase